MPAGREGLESKIFGGKKMSKEVAEMDRMIDYLEGNAFNSARSEIRKMRNYVPAIHSMCAREYENYPHKKHEIEKDFQELKLALLRAEHYAFRAGEYIKVKDSGLRESMKKNGIHYCIEARGILEKITK